MTKDYEFTITLFAFNWVLYVLENKVTKGLTLRSICRFSCVSDRYSYIAYKTGGII